MDVEANFSIGVFTNKSLNISIEDLELTGLSIVDDNCNAKPDQATIEANLNELMSLLEGAINEFLPKMNLTLPSFQSFDYVLALDYQDEALGVGIKLI